MTALVSVIPIVLLIVLMMGFKVSGYKSDSLSAWTLYNERKYEYNDHGDAVKQETYVDGSISERYLTEYKYVPVVYYGDTVIERRYGLEEYWSSSRTGVFAPSYKRQYDFDKNGNTIFESYYSSWDTLTSAWGYGYMEERKYE